MLVLAVSLLSGWPMTQMMLARAKAKRTLKQAPATNTIILVEYETGGSFSTSTSLLPSIGPRSASCGNST